MATFNDMLVTNAGKIIYSKAVAGKSIVFNGVAFGSGNPASQAEAETLTGLIDQKIVGSIESIDTTTTEGVAILTIQVSNEELDEPIGIKEIGVFCTDPDTSASVMYAYAFSPTDIDVIPSNASGTVVWKMRVNLTISNASGTATSQSEFMPYTPSVTAVSADGVTTFISEIVADCQYLVKGGSVTALYNITGRLSNMDNAESGLSSLTISLPKVSKVGCAVYSQMTVTTSDSDAVLVDILGEISAGSQVIDINYFGSQNGVFALKMATVYSA